MKHLAATIALLTVITALLTGCSSRAWYEGFRAQQRQACLDGPADQYPACMERANLSYDRYRQQREEAHPPK